MPQEVLQFGLYALFAVAAAWLFVDGLRKGETSLRGLKGNRVMSPQIYGGLMLLWVVGFVVSVSWAYTYGRELWTSGYFAGLLR